MPLTQLLSRLLPTTWQKDELVFGLVSEIWPGSIVIIKHPVVPYRAPTAVPRSGPENKIANKSDLAYREYYRPRKPPDPSSYVWLASSATRSFPSSSTLDILRPSSAIGTLVYASPEASRTVLVFRARLRLSSIIIPAAKTARSTTPSATPVPMPAFAPLSRDPSEVEGAVLKGAEPVDESRLLLIPFTGFVGETVFDKAVDRVVVAEDSVVVEDFVVEGNDVCSDGDTKAIVEASSSLGGGAWNISFVALLQVLTKLLS